LKGNQAHDALGSIAAGMSASRARFKPAALGLSTKTQRLPVRLQ
jgi:hypothetical protein